jgi:hypothetical protein
MTGEMVDVGICPDCKEHCGVIPEDGDDRDPEEVLKEAIHRVLDYLYIIEAKDFEFNPTKDHIHLELQKLREYSGWDPTERTDTI